MYAPLQQDHPLKRLCGNVVPGILPNDGFIYLPCLPAVPRHFMVLSQEKPSFVKLVRIVVLQHALGFTENLVVLLQVKEASSDQQLTFVGKVTIDPSVDEPPERPDGTLIILSRELHPRLFISDGCTRRDGKHCGQ